MDRCEFEKNAKIIKDKIEKDFQSIIKEDENIKNIFDKFAEDNRTKTFINYYNKIVLDRVKIR
jgi:hypothetical protein